MTETCLTTASLRERGWTDAMIREYLGEPDATRPNPRYSSAAPMKLYLAERAEAAEASAEWAERERLGARRRAAGLAAADRKRAETEALARQLAADLVSSLVIPANPRQAAIDAYNQLARRAGRENAHQVLRAALNSAIEARLNTARPATVESSSPAPR